MFLKDGTNTNIFKVYFNSMVMGDTDSVQIVRVVEPQRDLSYPIIHGIDLFPSIVKEMKKLAEKKKEKPSFAIITDSNVSRLYGQSLESRLREAGLKADMFVFEAGEQNKSIIVLAEELALEMSKRRYDRDSIILALGGGVVGDMAGLLAALYMRGIDYYGIPTTLLAGADSSIGGKTAVDVRNVKNLIGRFFPPRGVWIDVLTFKSLDDREIRSGLAETIKHGIIADKGFVDYLEENFGRILEKSEEHLLYISKQNCKIKGEVVEKDPNEKGVRRTLNYGHTIGHAVESLSGYTLTHGEAVSIGMIPAAEIAAEICGFPRKDIERQRKLLKIVGLPTTIPTNMTFEEIIAVTATDKKAKDGQAKYTLPERIGQMANFGGDYATYVKPELVMTALQASR